MKNPNTRDPSRQTWKDVKNASRDGDRWDRSKGISNTSAESTARYGSDKGESLVAGDKKNAAHVIDFLTPVAQRDTCLFNLNGPPADDPDEVALEPQILVLNTACAQGLVHDPRPAVNHGLNHDFQLFKDLLSDPPLDLPLPRVPDH